MENNSAARIVAGEIKRLVKARCALRSVVADLLFYLEESHAEEVRNRHHGDAGGSRPCTYCAAIRDAKRALKKYN